MESIYIYIGFRYERLELGQGDSMDMERIQVQEGGGKGCISGLQYMSP